MEKKYSLGITEGENYSKSDVRHHTLTVLPWTVCCLHPEEAHNCWECGHPAFLLTPQEFYL